MPNTKHITVDQTQQIMTSFATKADARFLKQADVVSYTVKKQDTAETGYASTYQLFTVGTGTGGADEAVGAKINIPKDMVVQSGTVETVTTADVPYAGAVVGDKYIDLVIANASSSHIYIPVNDLVDEYTAGNGIDITNNAVSVVVDSSNANGLSVGASGLALAAATTTTAGAMSAADKAKLDSADVTAYTGGNGIDITSHEVTAVVDSSNANGLSVGASGLALAAATTSTAGAMSASDKSKLDNADVTAYTGTGAIDITSHVVSISAATTSAAGSMSAEDKAKLDGADVTAYTAGNGIDVTSHEVSAVVDSSNANGLSVGASGIALAAATTSTAGAMSAADKTKLDGLDTASAQDIQDIIDSIWPAA